MSEVEKLTTNPEGLREQIARLIETLTRKAVEKLAVEDASGLIISPSPRLCEEIADAIISGPLQEQLKGSSGGRVQAAPDEGVPEGQP